MRACDVIAEREGKGTCTPCHEPHNIIYSIDVYKDVEYVVYTQFL
jgi:hypothetical protein